MSGQQPAVWVRYGDGATRTVPLDQVRADAFAESVPWRRFRSRRGQRHLSGRYWSSTTGGHVVYESRLELARLLLADFDPQVAGIWAQPCRVEATVGGVARGQRNLSTHTWTCTRPPPASSSPARRAPRSRCGSTRTPIVGEPTALRLTVSRSAPPTTPAAIADLARIDDADVE